MAEVTINQTTINTAIANAKKNNQSTIVITPNITGEAQKVNVELPKTSISSMVSETDATLKVETPVGTISIPQDALTAIATQAAGSTVTMSLESVDKFSLTPTQQETVGDKPVYDISIMSGSSHISSFNGKSITISLPYTLQEGESVGDVKVWYLNDAGELEQIDCTYDEKAGLATFKTSHLSYYLVGVEAAKDDFVINFTDVKESDWFYEAVKFAVENGLFKGTTETTFSPGQPMTRAMLVTVLHRLEGSPAVTGANNFTDVKNGEWYTNAVIWANANDIVSGYGNGLFGTNDPITREQMAAILYRYAGYKGYDVTAAANLAPIPMRQTSVVGQRRQCAGQMPRAYYRTYHNYADTKGQRHPCGSCLYPETVCGGFCGVLCGVNKALCKRIKRTAKEQTAHFRRRLTPPV